MNFFAQTQMKITLVIHFFVFWCLIPCASAQSTFIKEVGKNSGLPTQSIYDLFVDKDGFLYLGSEIGMIRYNGLEFKRIPFLNNKGNSVNAIQQAKNGQIWCMNFSNQIFFLRNDSLIAHDYINTQIEASGPLRSFAVINDDLWIVTDRLVFVYNKYRIFPVMNKSPNDKEGLFNEIVHHPSTGKTYILDQTYLYEVEDYRFSKKTRLTHNGQHELVIFGNTFLTAQKHIPSNNEILFKSNQTISPHLFPNSYLNKMVAIDNSIWLCTNDGLYDLNLSLSRQHAVILKNIRISDIVRDHEGGLWVSSVEKGLYYMPDKRIKLLNVSGFSHYAITPGPDNTLFVGTGDGKIKQIREDGTILRTISTDLLTEIEFIYFDEPNQRLITSHGVFYLNKKNNDFTFYLGKSVSKDDRGNFVIASFNKSFLVNSDFRSNPIPIKGFELSDLKLGTVLPFLEIRKNRSKSALYSHSEKKYFVGYADKLIAYDLEGNSYEIKNQSGKDIIANHLIERKNGDLLVGTIQDGVYIIRKGNIHAHINTVKGLSSNTCRKILEQNNVLYVLSEVGLDLINLNSLEVNPFPSFHFFNGIGFTDMALSNNNLCLSGSQGIIILPISLNTKTSVPKIHAIETTVNGEPTKLNSAKFSYNQNDLRFTIEAIHYQSEGDFTFVYRLKGYEKEWNFQSSRNNTVNYLSLPPGNFDFELYTSIDGKHSPIKQIAFTIAPPFWTTWWFRTGISILVILLLLALFKQNILRIRKKQLIKERLLISQMIALRAQMNPHFMFNVLNSVQGLIYMDKKNEASLYLGKFSTLMRRMLEYSDKPHLSLQKEIDLIDLYLDLESARFEGELDYQIDHKLKPEQLEFEIPSMIIQPYVENAIKHGLLHKKGQKTLKLFFTVDASNRLTIRIIDNGIGRELSKQINEKRKNHKSFASEAIDSRIGLINRIRKNPIEIQINDLCDDSGNGLGTEVIIKIPNEHE